MSELVNSEYLNSLKELDDEGEDIVSELGNLYLTQSPDIIKGINEAVAAKDAEALKNHAHKFKGSCSNIGLDRLAELAGQLEAAGNANDFSQVEGWAKELGEVFEKVKEILKNDWISA